ncbi:MAG: hypothetical protein GY746_17380, partial [Gammaproteobacteria bacterium]|nr:hypothetical protein [Gammaproteobacteria bacterium]
MLNYQRIFVPAIFIACVVFSGQVFADDAVSIKPKLIAVGSSEEVWALDASDNMLLYRRNPNTFRYEEVNSNIEVDALDVSLDGVVVALSGKKLYLWNEESQSFQQHGTAQQLDQVAIGDGAVWGLDGQTAYYWDSDNFDFAKAPGAFTTLTVAKEDDAVFAIGTDRKLYLWDGVQEQLESFNISLSGDIQLSARSKNNLWALVGNSRLYQWNSASSTFVDQTEKFALGIYLNQFALDSQKIIYGVSNNRLVFYDIESFAIEMDGTKEADGPVSTLDKNGKQHIIYNQGGSIYHSYAPSGAGSLSGWIEAKPISQSTGGTHLNVAVDNTGNVHASWISGVENSKEIYYAYGKPNSQVGGYNWSDTIRVSNDNVADDDLTMVLGPQGRPIFLTTKIDAIAPHADRDIYHHTLDMNENPPTFDGVVSLIPLQNEADHLEIDPLYNFLRAGDNVNLESSSNFAFSLTPLGAMSWTWDWKGKMIKFTVTGVYGRHTDRAGNVGMEPGIGGTLVIKLGEWTKTVFGYEISIEAFIEGAVEARYLWAYKHGVSQLLLKGDVDLLFEIPVYGNKADPAIDIITAPLQAAGIMPVWEISVIAGVRLQLFDFLWDPSSEEGGEEPENFCMAPYDPELGVEGSSLSLPPFLKITDKGGNPPAENTPNEDTRMHFDTESFASYMYSKFLSTSSGVGETESQFISHLGPGIGMKFEEKWGKGTAKFDFTAKMMFWLLFDLSGNKDLIFRQQFLIKQDAGPLTVTWLNLMFTEHLKGAVAPTAEYSPGGTATVHGERPLLGDGTGTNTVDEGALSSIIVGPKAYGVFTQETGDSTFQAVYVITGDVDQNTGDINWKPNTVFMIPQSGGFNTDPLLAAHYNAGSQQDDQLIVTWGSVPADSNPLVDSLANTPPGRTYVVYGQDAGNAVVDVSEFSTASGSDPGFYLTNQLALYGIGSSVGHLGDVDGNGVDDFIFGAPDAEVEQGRTYIVFGELFKPEITKVATASWLAEDAQDASSTYEVLLKFQGVDADGDNILRGRGSNLSAVDSGYVDELTEWTMEVYHKQRRNNELLATFGWDDKQAQGDFNFNFDLVKKQVFASDPDSLGLYGLNIGPGSNSVGRFNLQTSEYKEIQLIDNNNNSLTAAYTELGNDKFTTSSTTDTTSGGIQPDIDALKGLQGLVLAGGTDDELGFASGSAGDFNNDGRPDLMVSAPGANDHLGAVYILYGGSSLNSTTGIV